MHLFRLFPSAEYCVWVDGKLQLAIRPEVAIGEYLRATGAVFAAMRNLRRNNIDQEGLPSGPN